MVETHEKTVHVRIDRTSGCGHCDAGCLDRGKDMIAEAENSVGARVGDTVRVEYNPRAALNAVLIVFGLPLLALLLGVVLADAVANRMGLENHKELLNIGAGAALFFLTFIPIRAYDRRVRKSGSHSVVVVEILERANS